MKTVLGLFSFIVLAGCAGKQEIKSTEMSVFEPAVSNIVWSGSLVNYKVQLKGENNEEVKVAWFAGDRILCDWEPPTQNGISECEFEVDESVSSIIVESRKSEGGGSIMGLQLSVLMPEESQAMKD